MARILPATKTQFFLVGEGQERSSRVGFWTHRCRCGTVDSVRTRPPLSARTCPPPLSALSAMNVRPLHTEWLATEDAADRLGVTPRTLRRRAASGAIKKETRDDGRAYYRVPKATSSPDASARTSAPDTPGHVRPDVRAMSAPSPASEALRAELADVRQALVDAERRAAVAEYRAAVAETDPDEVDRLRRTVAEQDEDIAALRSEIEAVAGERDDARAQAQRLADAMVKRHGIIKRLTQRISDMTSVTL